MGYVQIHVGLKDVSPGPAAGLRDIARALTNDPVLSSSTFYALGSHSHISALSSHVRPERKSEQGSCEFVRSAWIAPLRADLWARPGVPVLQNQKTVLHGMEDGMA